MESVAFLPKGNFSRGGWLHREEHLLENAVPTRSGPNCTQGQRRVLTKQLAAPDTLVAVRHYCWQKARRSIVLCHSDLAVSLSFYGVKYENLEVLCREGKITLSSSLTSSPNPNPAVNSFIQERQILHPWATGHPGSGEGRAEASGPLGSLAGMALGHLSQAPGTQLCFTSHTEPEFRP